MSTYPVFATVYCEGRAAPVFSGVTTLPLVSESKLRKVVKTMFAQVRRVSLCVLKGELPIPAFVTKLGGELHFSLEEALAPVPTPKARVVRKVKRAKRKVAKKILRVKRSLHMTKSKGTRRVRVKKKSTRRG